MTTLLTTILSHSSAWPLLVSIAGIAFGAVRGVFYLVYRVFTVWYVLRGTTPDERLRMLRALPPMVHNPRLVAWLAPESKKPYIPRHDRKKRRPG